MSSALSCTDLTELNTNPAAASSMDPNLLLPSVQYFEASIMQNQVRVQIYPGGWTNHFTGYSGMVNNGARGVFNAGQANRVWQQYFPNPVKNVMALLQNAEKGSNIEAAGIIMKVETFMRLTDIYGDIPYSESGTVYETGIISPKYDQQKDIYDSFFSELAAASEQLSASGDAITSDLYFGGDIAKWKKYANSLRLRAAMRLVKVDPDRAKSEAEAAIKAGVLSSNDDIPYIACSDIRDNESAGNAVANFFRNYQTQMYVTNELIEALDGNAAVADPRLKLVAGSYLEQKYVDASPATDITAQVHDYYGKYIGLPAQCLPTADATYTGPAYSLDNITIKVDGKDVSVSQHYQRLRPSTLICKADAPYIKMSYAEMLLFQAEAKVRWNIGSTDAQTLYRNAIVAGCKQFTLFGATVSDSDASSYAQSKTLTSGEELELINTQLWLQYMFNPMEAWANMRRTDGMPTKYAKYYNYYPSVNSTNGEYPHRLPYPSTEQTRNEDNYNEAIARMGGTDTWTSRVWWDCK